MKTIRRIATACRPLIANGYFSRSWGNDFFHSNYLTFDRLWANTWDFYSINRTGRGLSASWTGNDTMTCWGTRTERWRSPSPQ